MSSEKCSLCETPTALAALILFEGQIICPACDAKITAERNKPFEQQLKELSPKDLQIMESHVFLHQLIERTPKTYFTKIIIGINLLIFAIMVFYGVPIMEPSVKELIGWGAANGHLITHGEWWRMFTSTFLHAGIIHLAFNMYVLKDIGQLVEKILGNKSFLVIYLISAFCGSVASIISHPYMSAGVGASGAVFGVYGGLLGILLALRNKLPKDMVDSLKKSSIFFLGINLVFGMSMTNIDMAAHIGGMIGGIICGALISMSITKSVNQRNFANIALCLVTALCLSVWGYSVKGSISNIDFEIREITADSFSLVGKYQQQLKAVLNSRSVKPNIENDVTRDWQALRERFKNSILTLDIPNKEHLSTFMERRFELGQKICQQLTLAMSLEPDKKQVEQIQKDLKAFQDLSY